MLQGLDEVPSSSVEAPEDDATASSGRLLQSLGGNRRPGSNDNNDQGTDSGFGGSLATPAAPPPAPSVPPGQSDPILALQSSLIDAMTDTLYSMLTLLGAAIACHCEHPTPICRMDIGHARALRSPCVPPT